MIKKEKELKVDLLKKDFSTNEGLIFADHSNMKSEQSMIIRGKFDEIEATLKIVKNSLANLAASECFENMDFTEILKGHTSIIISYKDMIATAKVLKNIIKEFDVLKVKAGILDGRLISAEEVDKLANLPSREVLLTQLAFGLISPMSALVNLLNNLPQKLVMTLAAIKKEKELQTN